MATASTSAPTKASASSLAILIGAQWGDEGKGKWIDYLAKDADLICRFQGGNNAGHTIYVQDVKVVLHQLPSAPFHPNTKLMLGANVVVNPVQLVSELERLKPLVTLNPDKVWLSDRAHVISPWNIHCDEKRESASQQPVGTTKRGIGPTYSDKMNRISITLSQYINPSLQEAWIKKRCDEDQEFLNFYQAHPQIWQDFKAAAQTLAPYVCSAEARLRKAISQKQNIILEGAQGTLLDICHGTYPFVTSSSTIAGGAIASLGFNPRAVTSIIGIAKAYTTRVGEGPFTTELKDEVGAALAKRGMEFGATTGRPRRCGWFDAVAMRYAVGVNGIDSLYLNKMDILSGMDELKIAVAYEHPTLGRLEDFPSDLDVLTQCRPVYESFKGWKEELARSGSSAQFPKAARDYLKAIEESSHVKIAAIGTGPRREEFVLHS